MNAVNVCKKLSRGYLVVDGMLKMDFLLVLTNDAFYTFNHKTHFSFALPNISVECTNPNLKSSQLA